MDVEIFEQMVEAVGVFAWLLKFHVKYNPVLESRGPSTRCCILLRVPPLESQMQVLTGKIHIFLMIHNSFIVNCNFIKYFSLVNFHP